MAKINHLEMGAYVMALNDIEVKKRFLRFELQTHLQTNQQCD